MSLTHPPSLIISLRWLSEPTSITELAGSLVCPAPHICICVSSLFAVPIDCYYDIMNSLSTQKAIKFVQKQFSTKRYQKYS